MMQFESDHGRVEVYERPPTSSQPVDMSLCRYPNIKTKRKRAPKKEKKKNRKEPKNKIKKEPTQGKVEVQSLGENGEEEEVQVMKEIFDLDDFLDGTHNNGNRNLLVSLTYFPLGTRHQRVSSHCPDGTPRSYMCARYTSPTFYTGGNGPPPSTASGSTSGVSSTIALSLVVRTT